MPFVAETRFLGGPFWIAVRAMQLVASASARTDSPAPSHPYPGTSAKSKLLKLFEIIQKFHQLLKPIQACLNILSENNLRMNLLIAVVLYHSQLSMHAGDLPPLLPRNLETRIVTKDGQSHQSIYRSATPAAHSWPWHDQIRPSPETLFGFNNFNFDIISEKLFNKKE
jgi:hypothetical protein